MLSNNTAHLVIISIGIVGAILFIIGSLIQRERNAQVATAAEMQLTQPELDLETRLDLVERLAMVGQPWCVEQLAKIRDSDPDGTVREAAEAGLLVIGARGTDT